MFSAIAKGVGAIVIGGIISVIAFHWTDQTAHDDVMEKLKDFHAKVDPTLVGEALRQELRNEADNLLALSRPRFVLLMTYTELEEAVDEYLASIVY